MSHPSLIEIEPTTSEFTLKYNNNGNVEEILTINPTGLTGDDGATKSVINGYGATLQNFIYEDVDISGVNITDLTMDNLIVSGKFSFNSYNSGDTYIASTSNNSQV